LKVDSGDAMQTMKSANPAFMMYSIPIVMRKYSKNESGALDTYRCIHQAEGEKIS